MGRVTVKILSVGVEVSQPSHLREIEVGGKVGPGLGGMGDSESGLAILLNCENNRIVFFKGDEDLFQKHSLYKGP